MAEEKKEGCGTGAVVLSVGCVSGVVLALVMSIVIVQFGPRFFKSQRPGNAAPSEVDAKGTPRPEESSKPASPAQVPDNVAEDKPKAPDATQDGSKPSETAANAPATAKPASDDSAQTKPIRKAVVDSEMAMHRRDFENAVKQAESAIGTMSKLESKAQESLKQELSALRKRADFVISYSRQELRTKASEKTVLPSVE
jgi:predicted lipid-binding transport protein (Tim44 family)